MNLLIQFFLSGLWIMYEPLGICPSSEWMNEISFSNSHSMSWRILNNFSKIDWVLVEAEFRQNYLSDFTTIHIYSSKASQSFSNCACLGQNSRHEVTSYLIISYSHNIFRNILLLRQENMYVIYSFLLRLWTISIARCQLWNVVIWKNYAWFFIDFVKSLKIILNSIHAIFLSSDLTCSSEIIRHDTKTDKETSGHQCIFLNYFA